LRWFHPQRGQIPTADFIAVAEETGLIGDIGRWALQRVCRDLCQWRSEGFELPCIAVNVSGRDFMYPEALMRLGDTVAQAIQVGIEYDPQPPFDGNAGRAPASVMELLQPRYQRAAAK